MQQPQPGFDPVTCGSATEYFSHYATAARPEEELALCVTGSALRARTTSACPSPTPSFSRSGANLVGHLEQPLRVVEAIDGLVTDVIGSPYVILRQPCGNISASEIEEAASASTTPSSNRSTGRRRRTVDSCNGKCKSVEIRSPVIMLSRHADDSRTERLATYQHQSVTLTSAIYEKKGESQSPEALLLRSEEVQRGLDTAATSMPRLLLRVRKPRRAIRRTTRQS
ncbi:hypothetical protein HPB51_004154 [Rhipicephalus microplus]|uniref:Uncharacterized protein n=1 Tax=Rhipicephalus microplus TaxID=6941 RepID=A0A9J6D3V2_RHIMP|nr:hypothetical protein HPB51_004154 [Rhipicephalus microplus]